ncbi:acyl-CoA dehydrogenase family protein [Sporichthya brevicatena]|uniref:Acyl-CoA dehydrogenase family protein n=1 Tax=Sporichthya brevicatena TaxID=171442 RepID=A0ABN1GIS2_9ACTN
MIEIVSPERAELVQLVRTFLDARSPLSEVRRWSERGTYDPAVWEQMSKELELPALAIPEEYGGMGFGPVELGLVMEELGRGLYNGPYLASAGLAASALLQSADSSSCTRYLPRIATGELRGCLAFAEPGSSWNGADPCTRAVDGNDGPVLHGTKTFVVGGLESDVIITSAADPTTGGTTLFAVESTSPGVTRTAMPTLDLTRPLTQIDFEAAPASRIGRPGEGADTLSRVLSVGAILLAAEQLGGSARCLEMAVEYAKIREQFGRPIGSFQAVKHRCVDMLVDVEASRSAVLLALTALANDSDFTAEAALARAQCSEAFSRVAAANVAVHGGIGFTWEHDAHLFLKRAKSSEQLLGSPSVHREVLASTFL